MTKTSKKVKSAKFPRRASSPTPAYARWDAHAKVIKTLRRTGEPAAGVPVVLHVEYVTVVLDEKIRAAARAASVWADVGCLLVDQCELCLESDAAHKLASALAQPVRGLDHGMAAAEWLLGRVPPGKHALVCRANLEDQHLRRGTLFYVKYQRICENRIGDLVLWARKIAREHGMKEAARSGRECLAGMASEAPWFRRALGLVLAAWRARDPELVNLMMGVKCAAKVRK